MKLFQASRQWATRPDDQRFWNVGELDQVVKDYRSRATEKTLPYRQLRARAVEGDEVQIVNETSGGAARLSHWAFGQLCARAEAPASYLRDLPATLASSLINHGLDKRAADDNAVMMFHENGSRIARSITSSRYDRIWNADVTPFLLDLRSRGWVNPPAWQAGDTRSRPATREDVGEYTIVTEGQMISPSGVYASDHDMFVFMVDPSRKINDGSADGLYRGFFVWNSEVGASSFGIMTFLFRYVCGNHIVWSASGVSRLKIRHVGNASYRFGREMMGTLTRYRDESATTDENAIAEMRKLKLGENKEEVLAKLFGFRLGVAQSVLVNAYDGANQERDGDRNTVYGYANALTSYSQRIPYADERIAVDKAAGKVMESAF